MLTGLEILIIFVVLLVGLCFYILIARRDVVSWNFKTFFLGGGNIGTDLTENNTIGITFAWSGGIWFFAWLAYQFGPWILVSQFFWCASIIALALMLPRIIKRVRNKTIHGFLGHHYGIKTQRVAALATTVGYFINGGFEIFWSSYLFASFLGNPNLSLPIALVLSIAVGIYLTIGGYKSSTTVDKPGNILGVIALAGLVWFVVQNLKIGGEFGLATVLFVVGSAIYVLLSLATYSKRLQASSKLLNWISLLFAFSSVAIVYLLLGETNVHSESVQSIVSNASVPWFLIISLVTFQIFFNIIDMQNWQQIAANEDADPRTYSALQWSIVRASFYFLWFPALGGILLGSALRALNTSITDSNLFTHAFNLVLPAGDEIIRGIILGVLFLGFFSTSISTVNTLLMSALQTIWYDIIWPGRIKKLADTDVVEESEKRFVLIARISLIPLAILMLLSFYILWILYSGSVLLFQPVIYAIPLSLLAPVIYALYWPSKASKEKETSVFLGIAFAIVIVIGMFVITTLPGQSDEIKNWLPSLMPLVANGVSILAILIGNSLIRVKSS